MFCSMPRKRSNDDLRRMLDSVHRASVMPGDSICSRCGLETHRFSELEPEAYSYLLGIYLGDGTVAKNGSSWTLRVTLDERYPSIIESCGHAIETVRPGHQPIVRMRPGGNRCASVESNWKGWPCLLPQHGPGRKHERRIELVRWQVELVDREPGAFVRGLIHSDGWRGENRVIAKGKRYSYPRYQFSNRSDDIRELFTSACDKLGVKWRPWTRYHISIAQRESVEILDKFVGPKR
jgi:hypothetical protein